jgi:hypothetical protein
VSVFGSLSFWVIFLLVFAAGLRVIIRHERARYRRASQHHGVQPHEQPKLILTDIGPDGFDNKVTHIYHVTTDPQAYAGLFVPPNEKE